VRVLLVLCGVLFAAGCGFQKECSWTCLKVVDGGCFAGSPGCVSHCPVPQCAIGYTLVEDAGMSCAPLPPEERRYCQ